MKKVLKIVVPILLVILFVVAMACYYLFPAETTNFIEQVKDFASQPIPIAGFTSLTVGGVVLLIVKYIISESKFGQKQLTEMKNELATTKQEYENEKIKSKVVQQIYREEAIKLREEMVEICKLIPNKKVNQRAKQIETNIGNIDNELAKLDERVKEYGERKETSNNQAEEN